MTRPAHVVLTGLAVLGLVGCATSAPPLPRVVGNAVEPGYVAAQAQGAVAVSSSAGSTVASTRPVVKPVFLVGRLVWDELLPEERSRIEAVAELRLLEADRYGLVMDVQGADNSTPGTTGGAALGGAAASAMYLDRGIRNNNYSATAGLAIGLLGAALGSSMDSGPTKSFQFRYTVQLGDAEIRYFDESKSTSFRHSVGVCLTVPELTLVSVQVCRQTVASIRQRFQLQPAAASLPEAAKVVVE